jgi:hypothetical protein
MEIRHVCQPCGELMAVHEHESWQEVKDCLAGMRALCRECASWPGCPSAGADAGIDGTQETHAAAAPDWVSQREHEAFSCSAVDDLVGEEPRDNDCHTNR